MTLYDPRSAERDACGIGFVASSHGSASRAIVSAALEALCRVKHRGAAAADALSGDGAGLLLPIPPNVAPAAHGVAMAFLDPEAPDAGRAVVAAAIAAEGLTLTAWRTVPVAQAALGGAAAATAPLVEQALLAPFPGGEDEGERRAYRARRRAESAARDARLPLSLASCSFRTVTYKALCAADRLASFYPDLADEGCSAWFALFHQRYSTNTASTWDRAQPFRMLAHNGEINTIRGNLAAMSARESAARRDGDDDGAGPYVEGTSSDSGILDGALELLVRGGRPLMHAAAMLVPPAWENDPAQDDSVRAFFRYHAALMEPWDGPAALVLSDGLSVGATLDRNGLRPLRVAICEDGLVACASEAGAVDTSGHGCVTRRRLGPGQSLVVDRQQGLLLDEDVKRGLAASAGYARLADATIERVSRGTPVPAPPGAVLPHQVAAGFTKEEMTVVLRPMATTGSEPVSSMGDDTAQPPLATYRRPVFSYLKQRFAQVTNPPLDHLRESHVMSLTTLLGPRVPLSGEAPARPLREYDSPLLFPDAVDVLRDQGAAVVDATWDAGEGAAGLERACRRIASEAVAAAEQGAPWVIVSDAAMGPERVAVPSALGAGAAHHALVTAGLRPRAGLVVDAADVRESHHLACLVTNGADAVCPRLALETIADLAAHARLGGDVTAAEAQELFFDALESGLAKIMSKMGISTVSSYRGAQVIEAVGLGPDVVALCFPGVSSPLGGRSFHDLGRDAVERHTAAYAVKPALAMPGSIKHKAGGEYHALNPGVVKALQSASAPPSDEMRAAHALRRAVAGAGGAYEEFAALVNGRPPAEPRDLLELVPAAAPVPLEEVEDAAEIARRFSAGAMSLGALSPEAHDTIARAMQMIGALANTGEGGEDPARYGDGSGSAIKQVASARFGVTPAYLADAQEIQIKMAQGSKPGEGGQLPGVKVSPEIARLRHTVPGVPLISPPPHHDIYSIEDLAQLIYDLKQANPDAAVSVKLVSSEGVGTVAAGVVKGFADVVHISGGDGGTGASPLSSIKNAGLPWEIGLAETQRALTENGLRGRARLRVDGGFKTGRDVVLAALLGADEFSFGTALLVAEGCILVRTCHRDTCPVGIATQNPALRAKFAGTPEMVARYLLLVAEEARSLLAGLGLRSISEAVGRTDLLRPSDATGSLDLAPLLRPNPAPRRFTGSLPLQRPRSELGDRLHRDAVEGITGGRVGHLAYDVTTADRSVGARLGVALARGTGARGSVTARFRGHAGQSFGAFLSDGIELVLEGEANDYVGKGMGGGRIVVRPPDGDGGDPVLAGNTVLYGATGGTLFVAGRAGERFAVRNSGAVAVVEGTGDHACEYMTAGAVVILGPTGRNLGAGMSGGEAYVFDPDGLLDANLNPHLVAAYVPAAAQLDSLRRVIERHARATGSGRAAALLKHWDRAAARFRRVAPMAEVARLEALFEGTSVPAA
ncbi:MAG TPA: glutamate synthase large subunit [Actinomycetota bacterium]|nr:glutamate synthase large subunit [Actinomycetota bacterium]